MATQLFKPLPGHFERISLVFYGCENLFLVLEDFVERTLVLQNGCLIVKDRLLIL